MTAREQTGKYLNKIRFFFPFVLLLGHLKYNLIGLLYWIVLGAIVTDHLGSAYGIPYLFLSPEYQGEISFWSFALLGFSFGGLTMAFNSYSYVRVGPRYPFLATVYKPFMKFCMNNAIIPVVFNVIYLYKMIRFQEVEEFASATEIMAYIISYSLGYLLFIGISLVYLFPTNKNFDDLIGKRNPVSKGHENRWTRLSQGKTLRYAAEGKHPLYWYVGKRFRLQQCRSTRHYSAALLQQVFAQNRISTTIFEVSTVITFVSFGLLGGTSTFDVPAAMSVVLLLTIILMLFSSLVSWLKTWTYLLLIVVLLTMNYLSVKWDVFQFENQAYGLNYKEETRVPYTNYSIRKNCTDSESIASDSLNYLHLLTQWKQNTGDKKPLLILVNTSGGGSRSAGWVFEVMRYCDSVSAGNFTQHIGLITGASGGMVGASYYRALKLMQKKGEKLDLGDAKYYDAITEDLLNKMCFAASTNDIFFRYQSKLKTGYSYNYDRGMAFEEDLNENTYGVLDHSLNYFAKPEREGKIPVIIYSPTVVNDGRRLLIASQPLSFLTGKKSSIDGMTRSFENIDIHHLLRGNDIDSIRYTSVLRMSATFPFVLPMVTLPTRPTIQVMDAGTRDNFGVKTMVQWMFALRDWIRKNTSGVLILQIRDTKKMMPGDEVRQITFLDKFTKPFSNVYGNFPRTQDFDQEELLMMSGFQHDFPVQFLSVNLREYSKDRISLSWHLTSKEKQKIRVAINSTGNRRAVNSLFVQLQASH